MEFLADVGGGLFGSIIGAIGGIASAFVKYKTMKEGNRHSFVMAELAGNQEQARAEAELAVTRIEGEIRTDIASEASLQESFRHDAAIGGWLKGKELGPITTGILMTAEFVRMMMRPVLTLWATIYVFKMYRGQFELIEASGGMPPDLLANQLILISQTIVVLATLSFSWWFADRSVAKALTKKIL